MAALNARVTDFLSQSIEHNTLHHAYCFVGPDHTDTRELVHTFARALMCLQGASLTPCGHCTSCKQTNHADLVTLDGETEALSIEIVREWLRSLTLTSFGRGRRVGVLYHAHMLPDRTQNVLLKTLEEPPANTVIMLTAHTPLIPTIMSRVQMLRVLPRLGGVDAHAQSTKLFETLALDGVTSELMSALAGEEAAATRMRSVALLEAGMKLMRERLLKSATHSPAATGKIFSSPYGMMQALDAARTSIRALSVNADPRLVLENFYYRIFA